jgi:hypothetical protein
LTLLKDSEYEIAPFDVFVVERYLEKISFRQPIFEEFKIEFTFVVNQLQNKASVIKPSQKLRL